MKRKRAKNASSGESSSGPPAKQSKRVAAGNLQSAYVVKHLLLAQYYPKVQTLRQYVLDKLPPTSKIRRRKILALGNAEPDTDTAARGSKRNLEEIRTELIELLDTTLIGTHVLPREVTQAQSDRHMQQWLDYSQRGDESHVTLSGSIDSAIQFQSEVSFPLPGYGTGVLSCCYNDPASIAHTAARLSTLSSGCCFPGRKSQVSGLTTCFAMVFEIT